MKNDNVTISELANKIRDARDKRLMDSERIKTTLKKFRKDFEGILNQLKLCGVSYKACFLVRKPDGHFYLMPHNTIHRGSVCTNDSILFKYNINGLPVKRKLFTDGKGWYFIAPDGNCLNATVFLENLEEDLILFLDEIRKGEYC